MTRTTTSTLADTCANLRAAGCDIGVDSNASGVAFTNASGNRTISERFQHKKDAATWLAGFRAGIAHVKRPVIIGSDVTFVVDPAKNCCNGNGHVVSHNGRRQTLVYHDLPDQPAEYRIGDTVYRQNERPEEFDLINKQFDFSLIPNRDRAVRDGKIFQVHFVNGKVWASDA